MKTFIIRTKDGEDHEIEGAYAFNNAKHGEGLIIRSDKDERDRSEIVAAFEPGAWLYYKVKTNRLSVEQHPTFNDDINAYAKTE